VVLQEDAETRAVGGDGSGRTACLIGMEACSGAHEWARRFQELGHTVRLMAPVFVAPYREERQERRQRC